MIGDDVIIGANAVVTRSVPARAIVAGMSAKVVRYRGEKAANASPGASALDSGREIESIGAGE